MYYEQRNINISRVSIKNHKFRITTPKNIDTLVQSIRRIGLINFPVVLPDDNEFIVLSGFRRLEAARTLGWTKMRASVLPPDTPMTFCVRICIADNSFQRSLNLIEISRALALLQEFFITPEAVLREAGWLGLPTGMNYLKKIEPLMRMPESVQRGILLGSLSLSTAWRLSQFPANDADAFAEIFASLNCSLNKQRDIITLVHEISIREDRSVMAILEEESFKSIISDEELDKNAKTRLIRSTLRRRRYPVITETEKSFFAEIEKLGLNERFRLMPPHDFEGDTYRLTLDFKSLDELKQHQKKLGEMITSPDLKKIVP